MRELKKGDAVEFIAENGAARPALVLKVHERGERSGGHLEFPALNVATTLEEDDLVHVVNDVPWHDTECWDETVKENKKRVPQKPPMWRFPSA